MSTPKNVPLSSNAALVVAKQSANPFEKKSYAGEIALLVLVLVLVASGLVFGLYLYPKYWKKVPSSIPPGGCPVGRACFTMSALGGDCSLPCVESQPATCNAGSSINSGIYLNSAPLLEIVDGAPVVISPLIQLPGGMYVFPTGQTAAAFLSGVLVTKDKQGNYAGEAAMFNASNPNGSTSYPIGFQQFPAGTNDGANFAAWVGKALAPRKDGKTNVGILLILNGGPAFFAAQTVAGTPAAPSSAAWNVLQGLQALGKCPVWQSLTGVGSTGAPVPQSYCAAYDFGSDTLQESIGSLNCLSQLQGMFSL